MSSPRDLLVEQLWGPALDSGDVRVQVGDGPPGWTEVESYWMFPDARRARLLLPRGPRAVTRAAAVHYRGLRRPSKNLSRSVLGLGARAGVPLAADRLGVWARDPSAAAAARLPLAVLGEALGAGPLFAAAGVRSGANRKATLHLLDASGTPVGYAKVGWSPVTDAFVRTEAATLREVGGHRGGRTQAPALLAEVDHHGHPVIVTEPLPLDVRGARSTAVVPPTSQEVFALTPVHRWGPLAGTTQMQVLGGRLRALPQDDVTRDVRGPALDLHERVRKHGADLPVTTRWHGDFAPWNRARDGSGRLWVWDWESSEPDAVAGLDPLHWAFSERRPASGRNQVVDLAGCLHDARPHLRAAGVPRSSEGAVAAAYALTVLERALDLAVRSGGWDRLWIRPDHLGVLAQQARGLLSGGDRER